MSQQTVVYWLAWLLTVLKGIGVMFHHKEIALFQGKTSLS